MMEKEDPWKRVHRAFSETTSLTCLSRMIHKRRKWVFAFLIGVMMMFTFLPQLNHHLLVSPEEQTTRSTLRIAWLMSFPNSGTSYTHVLVKELGDAYVATNYGQERTAVDENGNSVLLYPNETSGPFLMNQYEYTMDIPSKYILTKTHCGGGCLECHKDDNESNLEIFTDECRSGVRLDSHKEREVTYSDNIVVGRAVHLIRNPIDNIVSRFHNELQGRKRRNSTELLPNTKEGFLLYCNEYDTRRRRWQEWYRWLDTRLLEMLKNVPCHSDFLCYVQWHNMAFAVKKELQVPWYVLHYEKYATHFNETVAELLDFLHLEEEGEPIEFVPKKTYSNFFSNDEVESIKMAIKEMASETTWEYIQHYFE